MTNHLVTIAGHLTGVQAEGVVRSALGEWTSRGRRKLYYPYFWLQLGYAAHTLLGTSRLRMSCLVDARTALASTADPFEVERVDADAEEVMEPRLAEDEALRIARRYAAYVVRNRRKALVAPDVTALGRNLVFKPFWLIDGTKPQESSLRVIVDGVTGGFHALRRWDSGRRGSVVGSLRAVPESANATARMD